MNGEAEFVEALVEALQAYSPDELRDEHGRWTSGGGQGGGAEERRTDTERDLSSTPVMATSPLGGGTAKTLYVTMDNGMHGVFKPQSGAVMDHKQRGNISIGFQTAREVGAWEVAKLVGMDDMVSPCVERTINGEPGALLEYKEGTLGYQAPEEERYDGDQDLARAAAFDFVIGNEDRHGGNWLVNDKGKLQLFDHGLSFPEGRYESYFNQRFLDRAVDEALRPTPADLAAPYVTHAREITDKLTELGLPETAVSGVRNRIGVLAKTRDWRGLSD